MDLYLITGFLGAGKTTLLKNMAATLSSARLFIIVNEFGAAGVDGTLLAGLSTELREVAGGSAFCACREAQFHDALAAAVSAAPDAILVEASGLADPSSIGTVLAHPAFAALHYKGAVCVADAARHHKLAHTNETVKKQLAAAGLVLVNKADLADPQQLEMVVGLVRQAAPRAHVQITTQGALPPGWQDLLTATAPHEKSSRPDITLQKQTIRVGADTTLPELEALAAFIAPATLRLKGFARPAGLGWHLVDCVGAAVSVTPWDGSPPENDGRLVALAGPGMPLRQTLRAAVAQYPIAMEKD